MMEGSETANATAQIPMATMTPPRKATLRNVNLFIIGPLIRPRLLVIVPFKWTINDVCVAVISSEKKRSLKIRPKLCCIGSIASCNTVIFHRSLKMTFALARWNVKLFQVCLKLPYTTIVFWGDVAIANNITIK